jgi:hypothetical protein
MSEPMQTQHTTSIPNVRRSGERMRQDPLIRRWMECARSARDQAVSETCPEAKQKLRDEARFAAKTARSRFRCLMRERAEGCESIPSIGASTVDVSWIDEYGLRQKLSRPVRCF